MDEFFRTRMGHRFFESTLPKLTEELGRLNVNLEALVEELRKLREARASEVEPSGASDGPAD